MTQINHEKSTQRNSQINISNVNVEGNFEQIEFQSTIEKLKSGTNILGEIPILIQCLGCNWEKRKDEILTYCIEEMNKRDRKNIVILYDVSKIFKNVGKDVERLITDKEVVEYPSSKGKQKGISSLKNFIENDSHILVTHRNYFNGCEASNIIFLNNNGFGVRNSLMRGINNVICVQVSDYVKISGMKVENRYQ